MTTKSCKKKANYKENYQHNDSIYGMVKYMNMVWIH